MLPVPHIRAEDVEQRLTWQAVIDGIADGHRLPKAQIGDLLLSRGSRNLLNRAGWIEGIGPGLKSVTVFPDNPSASPPRPTVQGIFLLFDDQTGALKAMIDGALITKWKTAADSLLGAKLLANPEPRRLLVMGTGALAAAVFEAYTAVFPSLAEVSVWGRDPAKAERLISGTATCSSVVGEVVTDLAAAVAHADIITTATAAGVPVLKGECLRPGTHIDLAGAYLPETREADDVVLQRARVFVDSRETTLDHIGELKIPLTTGVISNSDILGDLYDLVGGQKGRTDASDITVFKNGGGAHLDLMTAAVIYEAWQTHQPVT